MGVPGWAVKQSVGPDAEALRQGRDLPCVEQATTRQDLRHHALVAHFGQVVLRQPVLLHQKAQHFARRGVRHVVVPGVVIGDQLTHDAKQAGQLAAFCALTGIPPAACAMVGDSIHDLDSGRAAGMTTIAVLTGLATRADLAPHADVVLTDIAELPAWLGI